MKRIITLLAIVCLYTTLAFSQKKYELVIEKTDGTEITVNSEDIVRTYFRVNGSNKTDYELAVEKKDGTEVAVHTALIVKTYYREREEEMAYKTCPDGNHPHLIDLGLPSGTKWACCNVGATTPEGYGNYYAWGETQPKSVYNWDTYQYGYYNYDNVDFSHLVNIGSNIAGTGYDAATANWGAPWRMPTKVQLEELWSDCTSEFTTQNGINGRKFTGPNGGAIFLPFAGIRSVDKLYNLGVYGYYWSASLNDSNPPYAHMFAFSSTSLFMDWWDRLFGMSVRPVR